MHSKQPKPANPLRDTAVIIAFIGLIGTVAAVIIPLLFREQPSAFVELTAQMIQTRAAASDRQTALALTPTVIFSQTSTLDYVVTSVPEPTASTLPPTATYTLTLAPTSLPTATPLPEVTHTFTATSAPISGVYPCAGEVVFSSGGSLNQVHVSPLRNSPTRVPVQQGSAVTIMDAQTNEGGLWLQISYGTDQRGWIPADYITPANTCPVELLQ